MLKPLILVRHLNVLPTLTHNRNINVIEWSNRLEYHVPLMGEVLKYKPEIVIENNILKLIYIKDGCKYNISD